VEITISKASPTDAVKPMDVKPPYQKLQPRWCGLSKDEIVADQRRRIYEAMVEIVASVGYAATTIKAVSALAQVSRQTFYDLFGAGPEHPKESCFLGAYDYVVDRAVQRIRLAYLSEQNPERRVCRAFEQFAAELAREPQAARFALVETLGAGPAALRRMEHGRRMFERMIAVSVSNRSADATFSPAVVRGIVGGVERVSRAYLLEDKIEQLSTTAGELSAWMSSYRPTRPVVRAETPSSSTRPSVRLRGQDGGLRIARAVAALAANDGYARLTPARICRLADVSEAEFTRCYPGPDAIEACFLSAFDLLGAEALICAAKAPRRAGGWPSDVRAGIQVLLEHVAEHPYLAPVAFVEIFAVGPSAIERRSAMLRRFADVFVRRIPAVQRPSDVVAEAIVGGIWAVVHDYVVRGRVHDLRKLVDDATYLALAPFLGHEATQALIGA
jgi:AcrR family transcriptional regulator